MPENTNYDGTLEIIYSLSHLLITNYINVSSYSVSSINNRLQVLRAVSSNSTNYTE